MQVTSRNFDDDHAANARVHQNKLFYKTHESINRKFLNLKGHYDD